VESQAESSPAISTKFVAAGIVLDTPAIDHSQDIEFVVVGRATPAGNFIERAKAPSTQAGHIIHLAHVDAR
jgi:hypothetical protein